MLVLLPVPHVQASRVSHSIPERQSGRLQNGPHLFDQTGHIVKQLRLFLVTLGYCHGVVRVHEASRELAKRARRNLTARRCGECRQIHFVEFNAEGAIKDFRAKIARRLIHVGGANHAYVVRKVEGAQCRIRIFLTAHQMRQINWQRIGDN